MHPHPRPRTLWLAAACSALWPQTATAAQVKVEGGLVRECAKAIPPRPGAIRDLGTGHRFASTGPSTDAC